MGSAPDMGAPVIVIDSVQIGQIITEGDPSQRGLLEREWTTAFHKNPVSGTVRLTRLGLDGDCVADTKNHGGEEKAVLCYAVSHYPKWQAEHAELSFGPGGFGENFTISGADEQSVCVGDQFEIGDCLVEVSQPRQPCWKISRRWRVKTMTKEVSQNGRTGWYLRVLREGDVQRGDTMKLTDRPHPQWTIARANDILFGREIDRMAVSELMNLDQLSREWKASIA